MPLKSLSCRICKGDFSYFKPEGERGRNKRFCSVVCTDAGLKEFAQTAAANRQLKPRQPRRKVAARCIVCADIFQKPTGSPTVACSHRCGGIWSTRDKKAAAYERNRRQCEHCNQDFIPFKKNSTQIANGYVQRYCSNECSRVAVEPMRALRRQEEKAARESAHLARELELSAARISRIASRKPPVEHKCQYCNGVFTPTYGDKRKTYYSPRCGKAAMRGRHGGSSRSRARRYGVPYESVDPIKVLQRDRWRCQLCGIPTPKRLRGTFEPNAPEVDHIVSLAEGGEHSYRNTQCACRACNLKKSSRSRGQMRLF